MERDEVKLLLLLSLTSSCCLGALEERLGEWQGWKEKHYKVYSSHGEEESRMEIWKQNYQKIIEHNMANHSFTLGLNQFADMVRFAA